MPRIARVCAINYPHHVTQRGNNRADVFFEDEDRVFYLKTLGIYSKKYGLDIWAYCLMTNHVHILAVPEREDSLARGIGGTNLIYTQYINHKYNRSGRLWQNRFYSTVTEKEEYLWAVARYIERNPVKAGLVKKSEFYPWSSAKAHILNTRDEMLSGNWLDENERETYKEYMMEDSQELDGLIRKATSTGRPLGKEVFIKMLEQELERSLLPKKAGRPKRDLS